jgi:methylglyoxal synthase
MIYILNIIQMKIALIAHDGKKADMVAFVMKRLDFFNNKQVEIVATGTTGGMIQRAGVDKVKTVYQDHSAEMLK